MSHPLDGCWAKLERAKEHLDTLKAEIANYAYEMTFTPDVDCERGLFMYTVTEPPTFPIRWGAIIGDILHNFRSALDYLAFEAVGLCEGRYWRNTQFPIVDWPDDYPAFTRNHGTMKRLTPELRALVEGAQGYSRGYGIFSEPRHSPLGMLRDYSNLDKHKLLLATGMTPDMTGEAHVIQSRDVELGKWFRYWSGLPLVKGTELLTLEVTCMGPDPYVQLQYAFRPVITFAGRGVRGGDVPRTLDEIGAFTTEVIRSFEPFFE